MFCITCKNEGFRRWDIAHSKAPVEFPDDKFSEEEISILEAEPMLFVTHVEDKVIAETLALEDMTVAALKELIDKLGLAYNMRATKAALIEVIEANTAEPPVEE